MIVEKLFYIYVHKAEGMNPLRAMKLLTKALCMGYWLGNM